MFLIFYTIILLGASYFVGRWQPHLKLWDYVDVIYYPLVMLGVVVFYFESVNLREAARMETERQVLQQKLSVIEGQRPQVSKHFTGASIVRNGGKLLREVSKLARMCKGTGYIPGCSVAVDIAEVTQEGERLLLSYNKPEDLYAVCSAGNAIFKEIFNNRNFSSFLMQPIVEHYSAGLKMDFQGIEFGRVGNYIIGVKQKLEQLAREMLNNLHLNDEDREMMQTRYQSQITYGINLLYAFEACLRAPEAIRSGQYAEWNTLLRDQQNKIVSVDSELREFRSLAARPNEAGLFRLLIWPYILVLTLSLKFAKGIASLRRLKAI